MALRRLFVLSSHLHPAVPEHPSSIDQRTGSNPLSSVSLVNCSDSHRSSSCRMDEPERRDCVFCMIIRGESPAFKLYEDDTCLCILDSQPLTHGHSLIIPKSHFSSLATTPPHVVAAMCAKVPFLSTAIMKATHCDSFNLLVNTGADAGQVIFHTHLHIIPRKAQDRLWTSKSLRRKPLKLNQDTIQLADCIREGLLQPQTTNCDACDDQRSKHAEST